MAEEERDRKWTVLRLRGLRKRWIVNTILPVLVLLMLLVTLVSVGVSTYYYSSMENGLMKQAEAMSSAFNDYFMNSYSEYNQMPPTARMIKTTRTICRSTSFMDVTSRMTPATRPLNSRGAETAMIFSPVSGSLPWKGVIS